MAQTESFLGAIKLFAGNFAPRGWAFCHGQIMPVSTNSALFALLGTRYGGDGRTTFQLPDLRNKTPVQVAELLEAGNTGGANAIRLRPDNLPPHTHTFDVKVNTGNENNPSIKNGILNTNAGPFNTSPPTSVSSILGGVTETPLKGAAIDIRNPYLTLNYIICISGGNYPPKS